MGRILLSENFNLINPYEMCLGYFSGIIHLSLKSCLFDLRGTNYIVRLYRMPKYLGLEKNIRVGDPRLSLHLILEPNKLHYGNVSEPIGDSFYLYIHRI